MSEPQILMGDISFALYGIILFVLGISIPDKNTPFWLKVTALFIAMLCLAVGMKLTTPEKLIDMKDSFILNPSQEYGSSIGKAAYFDYLEHKTPIHIEIVEKDEDDDE